MNGLGSWVIDMNTTPDVDRAYFTEYRNSKAGLIAGIALNLKCVMPYLGKSIYFCIVCKKEKSAAMNKVFARYQPPLPFKETTLRREDEMGFIAWMTKEEVKRTVDKLLSVICSEEVLGQEKVPQAIADELHTRIDQFVVKENPSMRQAAEGVHS